MCLVNQSRSHVVAGCLPSFVRMIRHHIGKHRAKSFSLSLSLPSTRSLVYLVRIVLTYHTFVNGVSSGRNWILGLVARFFREAPK